MNITVDVNNPVVMDIDGVLFSADGKTLLRYPMGRTGSYTVPNGTTHIADHAFYRCGLTSITIPNSVASVGLNAFSYCEELTSLDIPDTVELTTRGAFRGTNSLDKDSQQRIMSIDGDAFRR